MEKGGWQILSFPFLKACLGWHWVIQLAIPSKAMLIGTLIWRTDLNEKEQNLFLLCSNKKVGGEFSEFIIGHDSLL